MPRETKVCAHEPTSDKVPAHWIAYISVDDVDATVTKASSLGGKVIEPPSDIPGVGRRARIADPQGAEIWLLRNAAGDGRDVPMAPRGWFFWNELHTTDPTAAVAFYGAAIGYAHSTMDSPGGAYHVVEMDGVGRGGVTSHLAPGVAPHWLPYVAVDDVDATIARAKGLGARIPMSAEDIPGVGRLGVLQDPTGAVLAVMKPLPRQKQP